MYAAFIPTPMVFSVSKYLWLLINDICLMYGFVSVLLKNNFEKMILRISANLETDTLYTTQPPPSSSSFCLSEISDKKQVFT